MSELTLDERLAAFRKKIYGNSIKDSEQPVSPKSSTDASVNDIPEPDLDISPQSSVFDGYDLPDPSFESFNVTTSRSRASIDITSTVTGEAPRDPTRPFTSTLRIPKSTPGGKKHSLYAQKLLNSQRQPHRRSQSLQPTQNFRRSRSVTSSKDGVEISELTFPGPASWRSASAARHEGDYRTRFAKEQELASQHHSVNILRENIEDEKRRWMQQKEEQEYQLEQARLVQEKERMQFEAEIQAMKDQWAEQQRQLKSDKEKLKDKEEKLVKEDRRLRMESIKLRSMSNGSTKSLLGLDHINNQPDSSLKAEALELWLKEPYEKLEADRREVRRREQKVNQGWDEIHSYKAKLDRDTAKLKLAQADIQRTEAHIETLKGKFNRMEKENSKKQKHFSDVKTQLQSQLKQIREEKKAINAQKKTLAERKEKFEKESKALELQRAEVDAKDSDVAMREEKLQRGFSELKIQKEAFRQRQREFENEKKKYQKQKDLLLDDRVAFERKKASASDEFIRLEALTSSIDTKKKNMEERQEQLKEEEKRINAERKALQTEKQTLQTRRMAFQENRKLFYKQQREWKKTQNQLSKERLTKDEVVLPLSQIHSERMKVESPPDLSGTVTSTPESVESMSTDI